MKQKLFYFVPWDFLADRNDYDDESSNYYEEVHEIMNNIEAGATRKEITDAILEMVNAEVLEAIDKFYKTTLDEQLCGVYESLFDDFYGGYRKYCNVIEDDETLYILIIKDLPNKLYHKRFLPEIIDDLLDGYYTDKIRNGFKELLKQKRNEMNN